MYFLPNKVFNARSCGDNCAHLILHIGAKKNITINLHHMMDFGNGKFTIKIDNTGQIVHSMDEHVLVAGDCLQEMYRRGASIGSLFSTTMFRLSCRYGGTKRFIGKSVTGKANLLDLNDAYFG